LKTQGCGKVWRRVVGTALLLGSVLLAACSKSERVTYVTEHGLGPDKWATAWLLTQRVSPGAELSVVPIGELLPKGNPFDVKGSPILRKDTRSAFEVATAIYQLDDPDTQRLGRIIHDIEIGAWGAASDADSPIVEQAFRSLQERYGRDSTSPACYLKFFGNLNATIRQQRVSGVAMSAESLSVNCDQIAAQPTGNEIVAQVPIDFLLAEIKRGKSVVFIDVREEDEYLEAHIPGAINVPIRELHNGIAETLIAKPADYVVSYCIKDFRGFEMAKALKDAGVQNSVILKPYGIRGWVEEGLPTIGHKAMNEAEGERVFAECINDFAACKANQSRQHKK
jgi:rhodanese-related sulfurtransferase